MKNVPLLLLLAVGAAVVFAFYVVTKGRPVESRPPVASSFSDGGLISPTVDRGASKDNTPHENPAKVNAIQTSRQETGPVNSTESAIAEFKIRHRNKMTAQLNSDLSELMAGQGFTQSEIDLAVKNITDAFVKAEGTVKLGQAIDDTATTLGLDGNRKEALSNSVMSSVTRSTGKFTLSEFTECLNIRVARAPDCVKELAQDLLQKVALKSESDVLNTDAIYSLKPEGAATTKKAIEQCGLNSEAAEAYFEVNLAGCL